MTLSHRLHHFAVAVADLPATIDWYCEKLDFSIEKKFALPDADLEIVKLVSPGGVRIELLKHGRSSGSVLLGGGLVEPGRKHVCFDVDDIEAAATKLRRRGVRITQEPTYIKESNEKNLWIADNEGNMIEFIEELNE